MSKEIDRGSNLQWGCCHPTHAMRTKCACGRVVNLAGAFGDYIIECKCGRKHRKNSEPGGSFAPHSGVSSKGALTTGRRAGGREGCPGYEALLSPLPDTERSEP